MSQSNNINYKKWTPLFFAIVLAAGMVIGFRLNETLRTKRAFTTIIERNDRIEEIIDLISERYVDTLNQEALYQDAIDGILSHLDPHTSYIPAKDVAIINESLDGNFKGIGVEFFILEDTVRVLSLIPDGPALQSGIKISDKIIKINNDTIAGNNITNEKIITKLRGIENSTVSLTVLRKDNEIPVTVSIERKAIPISSIDAHYMLNKTTGYIRLNKFSATAFQEFKNALQKLKNEGMKDLIFDLRQNPGGYLEAAINILDEFIDSEQLLVYTNGKTFTQKDYKSQQEGIFEKGKLIVLVDESSASASEIVAGAVQDLNRGIIAGNRSYGKGLVQEQFTLSDGAALRLTVARYYTPKGKSIQRAYTLRNKDKNERVGQYHQQNDNTDTLSLNDSLAKIKDVERGGIIPDLELKRTNQKVSKDILEVFPVLDDATYVYYINHQDKFKAYQTIETFKKNYKADAEMLDFFKNELEKSDKKYAKDFWKNTENVEYIKYRSRLLIINFMFGSEGYYRALNKKDNVIIDALELIHSKQYEQKLNNKKDNPKDL